MPLGIGGWNDESAGCAGWLPCAGSSFGNDVVRRRASFLGFGAGGTAAAPSSSEAAASGSAAGSCAGAALTVAGVGTIGGLAGAIAGSRLLTSMLFEITPSDPATLGVVSLLLLVVATCAAYIPARRATMIDPARALRAE